MSQEAFGQIGGVGRQSQINYEKGERSPDATYLAGLAQAGHDVLYILTGQALKLAQGVAERGQSAYSPAESLAEEISTMQLSLEDADLLRGLARRLMSTSR
ncbi:hypothetical protein AADV58_10285 [Azonexus hydrophilus]|uniref:Transcriptional regulator n=1 Tax=Azonexus hydrophilus TaxID=418702 RepID=A0ABZ2XEH8_9RHOO